MAKKEKKSLSKAVAKEISKKFDLASFKTRKGLISNTKFKDLEWLPLSEGFSKTLSIPGIPLGYVTLLRGHTDTGKTTAMIEAAVSAQKAGMLPVFIVTEMKWNWEHAIEMGLEMETVEDGEGNVIDYKGNFIYVDRESLDSVEDVASFIIDLLDDQKAGNLPFNLLFLWDSVGSIPCRMSNEKKSNNNEWNAGAMSTQFGNNVNQRIVLSRKEGNPFTNTLVCVNKVWVAKPVVPMGQPKMMNKGGFTMWFDAGLVITFGNIANSGTSKIKAQNGGKTIEWAKRTNIQIDKNHINNISTRGKIIMTSHGFIVDSPTSIKKYKDEHSDEWAEILGGKNFKIVEEEFEADVIPMPDFEKEPE